MPWDLPFRRAPWEPGLLSVYPRGFAAAAAYIGKTRDEIYASLSEPIRPHGMRRYPDLTLQQAGQLASQAIRVRGVLDEFDARMNRTFTRQDLPRNEGLPNAYRYILNVHLREVGGSERRTITVVIDNDLNLGWRTLNQQAKEMAGGILLNQDYRVDRDEGVNYEVHAVDVVHAERRT